LKCTKFNFGCSFALLPHPAWTAHSAPWTLFSGKGKGARKKKDVWLGGRNDGAVTDPEILKKGMGEIQCICTVTNRGSIVPPPPPL